MSTDLRSALARMRAETMDQADAAGIPQAIRGHFDTYFGQLERATGHGPAAREQAARIAQDQRLAPEYKRQELGRIAGEARARAQADLEAAQGAARRARNELLQHMRPGVPGSAYGEDIRAGKADWQRLLDGIPDAHLPQHAAKRLGAALAMAKDPSATSGQRQQAALDAHILGGGPLDRYYEARNPHVATTLAQHLGTPEQRDFLRRLDGDPNAATSSGSSTLGAAHALAGTIVAAESGGFDR